MLMFDPVIVLPQNLFRIKSVRSFILDIVIVGQVTKKDSTFTKPYWFTGGGHNFVGYWFVLRLP